MNAVLRRRAATSTAITTIARRRLVQHGPAAVSVRHIARELGLTPAALYRYYDGLDAILDAVLAEIRAEVSAALARAQATADPADPRAQPVAVIRALRGWALDHPAEFGLAFVRKAVIVPAYRDWFATRTGYLRILGLLGLEVFGHVEPAEAEAMFEAELRLLGSPGGAG